MAPDLRCATPASSARRWATSAADGASAAFRFLSSEKVIPVSAATAPNRRELWFVALQEHCISTLSTNEESEQEETEMTLTPTEVLAAILDNPTDIDHVRSLTTSDVTYVSLNFDNPDLKRIMPWCGTSTGPESIVKTFVDVAHYWEKKEFEVMALFGSGENVALFGRMTYKSIVQSKLVTSPFAVFAKVTNGKCSYMQFMEDTFATGASFRSGGAWTFGSNPNGEIVTI